MAKKIDKEEESVETYELTEEDKKKSKKSGKVHGDPVVEF